MRAIALALLLTGCAAPGVQMSDAEREACEKDGCTVWTRAELTQFFQRAVKMGYELGKKSL
jgi:hypothetical protein